MKIQNTPPTGTAQGFEINETFFSTTDPGGVITAGNQVFSRTSGYELEELIGRPHNIIRHHEVPRCVFKLLWETSRAGHHFIGYVKNQARNGNHYWVLAVIVPIPSGYLSVRIKPTTKLQSAVEQLYAKLLALESAQIASGASEGAAATASAAVLASEIQKLGFPSYEAFSHHCLNEEVRSRDTEISRRQLRLFPAELPKGSTEASLQSFFQQASITYERLNVLVDSLAPFAAIGESIRQRKDAVEQIAEDFRLNALNAHVAAHPLGAEGVIIGTVAQFLNGHANTLKGNVSALTTTIRDTTSAVTSIASNISVARIQMEMLLSFIAEVASRSTAGENSRLLAMARDLRNAFATTVDSAMRSIADLQGRIPQVVANNEQLRKDIIYLHVAQISGLTEAARLREAGNFQTMFASLRDQIESAKVQLEELGNIVGQLTLLTDRTPPQFKSIHESLGLMQDLGDEARAG